MGNALNEKKKLARSALGAYYHIIFPNFVCETAMNREKSAFYSFVGTVLLSHK